MDAKIHLQLEPTFPLDAQEIETRVRRAMREQLVPWGLLGLAVTVLLAFPLGVTGVLLGAGATAFALYRMFQKSRARMEARVISDMIRENNRSQDAQLAKVVTELQEHGLHTYAAALGKFLLMKQRIESSLHEKESPALRSHDLDNSVDRICALTCDHLWKLGKLDEAVGAALTSRDQEKLKALECERVQVLLHVQRAYCTMYECLEMLLGCKSALTIGSVYSSTADPEKLAAMDKAIRQLEEENSALKRLTQRMQHDLSPPPAPSELYGTGEIPNPDRPDPEKAHPTAE